LVIDDEAHARDEIAFLLEKDRRIASVRCACSGAAALKMLSSESFDVLFCDIKMPGLDGLELARVVAQFSTPLLVVFVTAYEDHAVDAFNLQATDYVMKPIRADRLREAVRRAAASKYGRTDRGDDGEDEVIPVELGGVTKFVRRSQVRYVEAHGDYARLHTDDDSHLIRTTLNVLEERWSDAGFVRVHRSILVRLDRVDEMIRSVDGHVTLLLGSDELPVSRRHYRDLRDRLASR
jgi:DNA-binding LytR/AlgR family response regulator